ncbi:CDGSH iron-sulfur domain-containing protein 3, mitochondrial [Neopelma chrysocephalum]|uniref:CDGSH iron-sulfur domain-containing protein 3, mitochondrial n=1 Tax=Neopelma chrysocephalum TaxID=114329 RepID=UPI000FCD2E46|nr:CDGSH iron-sulfur domain-containing protein 3, mitochondrial [Neopelma chrysocephalum]
MHRLSPAALGALLRVPRGRAPFSSSSSSSSSSSAPPQPAIAAKEPFPVELKAGKTYAWCSCGHSKRQPFCDGSHKKAAPGMSSLRFTPQEDGPAWLCGCKRTQNPPYCDGTHNGEEVQGAPLPPQP